MCESARRAGGCVGGTDTAIVPVMRNKYTVAWSVGNTFGAFGARSKAEARELIRDIVGRGHATERQPGTWRLMSIDREELASGRVSRSGRITTH